MTRRENLQERYEDALFALLMDDFATAEGKIAVEENERLKNDPTFSVPPEVRQRCLKTISRCCTRKTLGKTGRIIYRGFSRIAVVAMACMLLFTTAFAVLPTLRANTLNFIIEVFDDRTELRFIDRASEENSNEGRDDVVVDWLPEGYSLVEQTIYSMFIKNQYSNMESKKTFSICIYLGMNSTVGLDTEEAQVEKRTIQGQPGLLIMKRGGVQIAWGNQEGAYQIVIEMKDAGEEDIENLLTVAEHIVVKDD